MKVEKGDGFERAGKHFCSEQHAQQYTDQMQKAMPGHGAASHHSMSNGGCCQG